MKYSIPMTTIAQAANKPPFCPVCLDEIKRNPPANRVATIIVARLGAKLVIDETGAKLLRKIDCAVHGRQTLIDQILGGTIHAKT